MRLGKSNLKADNGLEDVVDSMPYRSEFGLAGCPLGDVGASVNVSQGGVKASGGFNWTTLLLIAGGFFLFKKYVK